MSAGVNDVVPIYVVNDLLHIDADITVRGDEVKCWVHSEEGGRDKTYLSREQCASLGEAFIRLSAVLK